MPRVFARPFPFDSELNNLWDLLTFGPDDIVVSDEIKLIFEVRADDHRRRRLIFARHKRLKLNVHNRVNLT